MTGIHRRFRFKQLEEVRDTSLFYRSIVSQLLDNEQNTRGACASLEDDGKTCFSSSHKFGRGHHGQLKSWILSGCVFLTLLIYSSWMSTHRIHNQFYISFELSRKKILPLKKFPRMIGYAPILSNVSIRSHCIYRYFAIDVNSEHYPSKRQMKAIGNLTKQREIEYDDDYYGYSNLNPDITEECQLRYDWQKKTITSCNSVHEFDTTSPFVVSGPDQRVRRRYNLIGEGYWRSVFTVNQDVVYDTSINGRSNDASKIVVLKTMRFMHEFSPRNFDRMRRDALIMERLTVSKFVMDIYGFCGTTSFSEYGDGKDISSSIWPRDTQKNKHLITQLDKLHIGTVCFNMFCPTRYFC
jgi:hypothetical protein